MKAIPFDELEQLLLSANMKSQPLSGGAAGAVPGCAKLAVAVAASVVLWIPTMLANALGVVALGLTFTVSVVVLMTTWLAAIVTPLAAAYAIATLVASVVSVFEVQLDPEGPTFGWARQLAAASAAESATTCVWWCLAYQLATSIPSAAIPSITTIESERMTSDCPASSAWSLRKAVCSDARIRDAHRHAR